MKEQHQFLNEYPLSENLEYLIVGTIHPNFQLHTFALPYYYGNIRSIYVILQEVYPGCNFNSIEEIRGWEVKHKIGFTDTVQSCRRINPKSATDKNLILEKVDYNYDLKEYILRNLNSLKKILFTSGNNVNGALANFQIIMGEELRLVKHLVVVLPSPSGNSNISLFKGQPEFFGLKEDFYQFLFNEYPEAIEHAKMTWNKKITAPKTKIKRLPSDRRYTAEFKHWLYKKHFPEQDYVV